MRPPSRPFMLVTPCSSTTKPISLAFLSAVLIAHCAFAQKNVVEAHDWSSTAPAAITGPRFALQIMGGYYDYSGLGPGAPFGSTLDPEFDYAPFNVRLGLLLGSPSDKQSLFRGTGEILVDVLVAPVTKGYADIVVGPSILLRYNFVQPNARLVPYIQGGAGIVYSDAYKTEGQDALGEAVEFILQCQLGVRCILNDRWSLDLEGGFQHISNAGFADRNGGINNLGGSVGFTYYLPQFRRK